MRIEERLAALKITLPELRPPLGNYVHAKQAGDLLFLAGKGPGDAGGKMLVGKVGGDGTTEVAYKHARLVGLMLIAVMKDALGDLDRVADIVKVLGIVNPTPGFT